MKRCCQTWPGRPGWAAAISATAQAWCFKTFPSLRENLAALAETGAGAGTEPGTGRRANWFLPSPGRRASGPAWAQPCMTRNPRRGQCWDRCGGILQDARGASLLDIMFGRNGAEQELDNPAWTQPAIYALECALNAVWSNLGIRPDVIVGHSLGEIAAAQAAGVFRPGAGLAVRGATGSADGGVAGRRRHGRGVRTGIPGWRQRWKNTSRLRPVQW